MMSETQKYTTTSMLSSLLCNSSVVTLGYFKFGSGGASIVENSYPLLAGAYPYDSSSKMYLIRRQDLAHDGI